MNKLQLSDDEFIIKKYDDVLGYPNENGFDGELYITNKNLIFWYNKGIIKKNPHIEKIPYLKIKSPNGVYSLKYNDEDEIVEIFYPGGQAEFCFDDEEIAMNFIKDLENCLNNSSLQNSINDIQVTSEENNICNKCGQLNDANAKYCNNCGVNLYENKVISMNNLIKNKSTSKKNKCKACGAILKGNSGETVKCEYCDCVQVLE